jgi:hypothetical protein
MYYRIKYCLVGPVTARALMAVELEKKSAWKSRGKRKH